MKDLSWAVKQPPWNAVVPSHSEPGLSRNPILTIFVSVAPTFVFLKVLHHGTYSPMANFQANKKDQALRL